MSQHVEVCIARICVPNRDAAGVGFLIENRRILICAHVVATTLGISEDTPGIPTDEVLLDFPLIEPERIRAARVIHWDTERDVAGLELTDDPPADAQPVRMVTADDLWGHVFRAFGFPAGYDEGVWTSGVLRGRIGSGWVQIEDVKEPGYWVQPGFSGTPIWDEQLDGVVGMAVAADTDRVTKAAFMIPAKALVEAWPKLAERSLKAGSREHLQMQLARLENAQHRAVDPGRFQPQIDALMERIAAWDGRVERQRQRIAEGLEEQRQRMAEEQARRREEERLQVVGQPPLDVADYFKDRQRDLQKLGQLLSEPTTRLVSVIGHGGMGKTALACKVLQDLERRRWPYTEDELPIDGIVYLSTRTAGISLERLFLDCAKLLGGEEQERLNAVWTNPQLETEEKIARLLETLRNGHYVILLDNLEDLLNDQGQITDDDLGLFFERALASSQGAQLMVTSRVALAFRREVMRFDRQVKLLEGLPTEDGVELLRELDPNGDYGLCDAPEEQLAEAVELAHGVPRALEVLAGILANDPFAALDEVLGTFYEQEDVVQALIEENYQRLDRDARRVIEALAVFRKPVPPLAVDYLLEPFAPGLDVPSVMQRLTRTNIVSVDRAAKTVTLHPIDQDYAYSQLPEEDEAETDYTRQALERRAADYYVQLRTPEETWESIEDLEPQLNEFEHRVRAEDYDRACCVLEPVDFGYLHLWGHYGRLNELREKLVGHLKAPSLQAINRDSLGRLYHDLGQFEKAIDLHKQALSIAREINNRQIKMTFLNNLGRVYHDLGRSEYAIRLHKKALLIARERENLREQGNQLSRLGRAYRQLGHFDQALEFFEESLVITRKVGDRRREGDILGSMGKVYSACGQMEQAIRLHEKALAVAREICHRWGEGANLGYLGMVYSDLGQNKQAVKILREALVITREIGDRRNEIIWLNTLGEVYRLLGQVRRASQLYEKALENAREIGYLIGESYQLLGLGHLLLAEGKISKAQQCYAEARVLDVPDTRHQAVLWQAIVHLHKCNQRDDEMFEDAVSCCRGRLEKTENLYESRYALATALVGQAVCDSRWADGNKRPDLLAPALEEYRRALEITAAPGVVQDAIRDLELIQAAGIEGLEPAFELLENAEYEPDLPEDLPDILEDLLQEDQE